MVLSSETLSEITGLSPMSFSHLLTDTFWWEKAENGTDDDVQSTKLPTKI